MINLAYIQKSIITLYHNNLLTIRCWISWVVPMVMHARCMAVLPMLSRWLMPATCWWPFAAPKSRSRISGTSHTSLVMWSAVLLSLSVAWASRVGHCIRAATTDAFPFRQTDNDQRTVALIIPKIDIDTAFNLVITESGQESNDLLPMPWKAQCCPIH